MPKMIAFDEQARRSLEAGMNKLADAVPTMRRGPMLLANEQHAGRRLMDRIWLKNYPAGVPADIDPTRYSSLVAMLDT